MKGLAALAPADEVDIHLPLYIDPPGLQALLCAHGVCRVAEKHAAGCRKFTAEEVAFAQAAEQLQATLAARREAAKRLQEGG